MTGGPDTDYIATHLAALLGQVASGDAALLQDIVAQLVQRTQDGHSAVDLADIGAQTGSTRDQLQTALGASGVCGAPGEFYPLVLDQQHRLYLHRYWRYERDVAAALIERAGAQCDVGDDRRVAASLNELFPRAQEADQKRAAAVAALRRLAVISGGPGTGKTTTVVRLLALLQRIQPGIRVALAAPTGKAAARVSASIVAARDELPSADTTVQIPGEASTLHRLLGYRPGRAGYRHHRDNPLPHDVIVVDEASMIGVALMAQLLSALSPDSRLILLGDRDQLDSVEPGSVLGDICADSGGYSTAFAARLQAVGVDARPAPPRSRVQDCVVTLRHSYRFDTESAIGRLAAAVRDGDSPQVLQLLEQGGDVALHTHTDHDQMRQALRQRIVAGLRPYFQSVRDTAQPAVRAALFERFRLLGVFRRGAAGVSGLNRLAEDALAAEDLIERDTTWYPGRPVMITRNDYTAALFNGDIGFAVPGQTPPAVEFASSGGWRRLATPRLPEHETVYAMTVHKTQGSEFDEVVLVLPRDPSETIGREVIYTAITRARRRVEIFGDPQVLVHAIGRDRQRSSGLRAALALRTPMGPGVQGELEL